MSTIVSGTPLRMVTAHKFDVPVCREYFPNGLTSEHTLIAMDRASEGRVTVMVSGAFPRSSGSQDVWVNPCFRLPTYEVEALDA